MALVLMSPREVFPLTVNGTHSARCKESKEVSASRHSCLTDSFILQVCFHLWTDPAWGKAGWHTTFKGRLVQFRKVALEKSFRRNGKQPIESLPWNVVTFIHSSYKIAQEMVESACLTTTDRRVRVGTLGLFSGHQRCFGDMKARRHRPTGVLIRSGFDFAWNRKHIIRHLMVALFLKVSL